MEHEDLGQKRVTWAAGILAHKSDDGFEGLMFRGWQREAQGHCDVDGRIVYSEVISGEKREPIGGGTIEQRKKAGLLEKAQEDVKIAGLLVRARAGRPENVGEGAIVQLALRAEGGGQEKEGGEAEQAVRLQQHSSR